MHLQWSLRETLRAGEARGPQEGMHLLYSVCEVRVPEIKSSSASSRQSGAQRHGASVKKESEPCRLEVNSLILRAAIFYYRAGRNLT